QSPKHGVELAFQQIAANGLATRNAALALAQIIGMASRAALAPASSIGRAAIGAGDIAPQREIFVHVLACKHAGLASNDVLNLLVGSQRDDGLMLTALHDNAPFGCMDITSVKR